MTIGMIFHEYVVVVDDISMLADDVFTIMYSVVPEEEEAMVVENGFVLVKEDGEIVHESAVDERHGGLLLHDDVMYKEFI